MHKVKTKTKKRLGRGYGSGKGGHTSSRGQKGQKTRNKMHPLFEGVKVKKSLLRRLPLQRGKLKNKSISPKPYILKLDDLNSLPANSTVTVDLLIKSNLVPTNAQKVGVKILSGGKLTKKLTLKVPTSASVARQIDSKNAKIK
jgi:large subunit ribosomal protein L15